MTDEISVNNSVLRLAKTDIADMEVESFVYYAQHDLALGSGFGTAISVRGGPSVQKELDALGPLRTTDVVVSGAGEMKAGHIIHPTRMAVSGKTKGAGLFEMMEVLGKDRVLARMRRAANGRS